MINKILDYFKKIQDRTDIHTYEVITKSSSAMIVKLIGMIAGLILSIFVARLIGAEGVGIISLSNKIVAIILIIGLVGMPAVIIKEVAIAKNKNDLQAISNVMKTAYWLNGSIIFILSIVIILISPWLANSVFKKPDLLIPLIIMTVVMTPQVFSRIFSSGLIGFKKIWQSNLVKNTLSSSISGVLLFIVWLIEIEITIIIIAFIYAMGRLIVAISIGFYWKYLNQIKIQSKTILRKLIKTALPLYVVSISGILINQLDIIILAFFADAKEVGLYAVASRLALLTIFFLQITNSAVSPKIAYLFASKNKNELQTMIQKTTRILAVISIFPMLTYLFFGNHILSIWGEEFTNAFQILIVLSFGQLVNTVTGAVGQILIMTGEEVLQSKITIFFAIWGIIQAIILGYFFGVYGIAYSQAINISMVNIVKSFYVYKRLNIDIYGLSKIKF